MGSRSLGRPHLGTSHHLPRTRRSLQFPAAPCVPGSPPGRSPSPVTCRMSSAAAACAARGSGDVFRGVSRSTGHSTARRQLSPGTGRCPPARPPFRPQIRSPTSPTVHHPDTVSSLRASGPAGGPDAPNGTGPLPPRVRSGDVRAVPATASAAGAPVGQEPRAEHEQTGHRVEVPGLPRLERRRVGRQELVAARCIEREPVRVRLAERPGRGRARTVRGRVGHAREPTNRRRTPWQSSPDGTMRAPCDEDPPWGQCCLP